MGCAWALRKVWNDSADPADKNNSLTVFESGSYIGGHTNTLQVPVEKLGDEAEKIYGGKPLSVDTGFIVYNDGQYPNLIRFFEDLKVETQDSDMSFSLGVRVRDGLKGRSPLCPEDD
jgi:predicted NAD/FAD-binding protein